MTPCVITPLCCLLIRHIKPKHLLWYDSEGTGGVTGRTSFPSRPTVSGEHRRHSETVCFFGYHMVIIEVGRKTISRRVYVPVFAFIFQVKGHMCHICLSLKKQTLRRFNEHSDVWHLVRHVNMSNTIVLPSKHTTLSKQHAGWWGKPPCDQMFVMPMWSESQEARSENHNSCGRPRKWRLLHGSLMTADWASAAKELQGLLLRESSVIVSIVFEGWPC